MSGIEQKTTPKGASRGAERLRKTVVLVGMMGAGKTAVGKALALRLGVPFLDSDHEIERAANMTVPEIFARDGEPFFRLKERQVIARLLEEERGVLSTGGGAFLSEENRTLITEGGVSVWLQADLEVLWNRVRHRDSRPLLRTSDPKATLRELYDARVPFYEKADLTVKSDGQASIETMVDRVLEDHDVAALGLVCEPAARDQRQIERQRIARIAVGPFLRRDRIARHQAGHHALARDREQRECEGAHGQREKGDQQHKRQQARQPAAARIVSGLVRRACFALFIHRHST